MQESGGLKTEFSEPDGHEFVARAGVGRRSQWFQARQVRLDRMVALKYLRPFLAESPLFQQMFLDAGRQAAVIVHPSALPIINVYPAHHCLAVQWCPGRPLRELAGALDPVATARVGEVVMDCLASLHATDRCHGNLTPGNIFLDDDGGVWLDDFFQPPIMNDGLREFRAEQAYVAPEFIQSGRLDWRTDVYSLGGVLDSLIDRKERPRELAGIIEAMRALDPARRGETHGTVRSVLGRVRRLEESRLGVEPGGRRQKRRYRRVPGEFAVSMRRRSATPDETAVILNRIRDIGESGVFVETDDALIVVGSILELDFALKGVEGNVHAFGIVRWVSLPPMPRGVGVQFVEVDQSGLRRLRQFLEEK